MQKRKLGLPALSFGAPSAPPPPPPAAIATPPGKKTPLRAADMNRRPHEQQQQQCGPSKISAPSVPVRQQRVINLKFDEAEDESETSATATSATKSSNTNTNSSSSNTATSTSASPGSDLTLSNSDASSCDDDDDDTFSLYVPMDGVNHEPIATPPPGHHKKHHHHHHRSNGGGASSSAARRTNPKQQRAMADAATSTMHDGSSSGHGGGCGEDVSDDAKHFQAQLSRAERERDTYSSDAAFFRDAAEKLKAQLLFSKQQMARQLEFAAEQLCRGELEQCEEEARELVAAFLAGRRSLVAQVAEASEKCSSFKKQREEEHSQFVGRIAELQRELDAKSEELVALKPRVESLSSDRDSLQQRLAQARSELDQSQQSIRAMTASWQDKFNAVRAQHEKLQQRFSTASIAETKLRATEEQLRKMKRGAHLVEARALLGAVLEAENRERSSIEAACSEAMALVSGAFFADTKQLVQQLSEVGRKAMQAEADAVKCRKRFDAVSAENEDLVKHNAELQAEVLELRRKVFSA